MSEAPASLPRPGRNTAIGVAALVLYVLSVGPALKLATNGRISWNSYQEVYAPLHWLYWHDSIVTKNFLDWYYHHPHWGELDPWDDSFFSYP